LDSAAYKHVRSGFHAFCLQGLTAHNLTFSAV
jgi:hypothetical protein